MTYDLLRLEVWASGAAMLMVTVLKGATYEVRYTLDCQAIHRVLVSNADPASIRPEEMTTTGDFGLAAAAEKYAKRFLLTRTTPVKDGQPPWESLYDGPLTIAILHRPDTRFPRMLEKLNADAEKDSPVTANTTVVSPEDFAAVRAAYRHRKKAEAAAHAGRLALSAANHATVRATSSSTTPVHVVGMAVSGLLPDGTTVAGTVLRIARTSWGGNYTREYEILTTLSAVGKVICWSLVGGTYDDNPFATTNP
tara:strand:+ start:743 stop:1498 length:756 start_codon:yes stop_codon:yes gene_type:complete